MPDSSVKQVTINHRLVGLVGLDAVVDEAVKSCSDKSDEEIVNFLLDTVSKQNYIPSAAREAYAGALLREYKIANNLPVDPEPLSGLTILVLGMGCSRCDQLQSDILNLLSEMEIAADVRHVTDIREISRFGVLGAPALVINNKVVYTGGVPPKTQIRQWITEALTI